jgi:hypothetical protein
MVPTEQFGPKGKYTKFVGQSLQGAIQVVSLIQGNFVFMPSIGLGFGGLQFIASFRIVLPELMLISILAKDNSFEAMQSVLPGK